MNKAELHAHIEEHQSNICQIEVLQHGREMYADEWNGYAKTDCVHIMSVTKSVMALLVGIALDNGFIGSVDDKVLDYFPGYRVKRGEKTIYEVTLRHLFTMRAPYKGKGDPWTKVYTSADWTEASLDFLGGKEGLTDAFAYRTVCLHILSGVLYEATGLKTVDFANRYLFEPLGIAPHRNFYARNAAEHKQFTLDKRPRQSVWFADPQGLGTPGYGLCMSACDMAKIGLLCLNGGEYNGKRIVSGQWLRDMTAPRKVESDMFRGMSYGYLWWIIHPESGIYAAIGNSGNVIYADPGKDLVVAVASVFKPTVSDRVDFIEQVLLPAVAQA